MSFESSPFGYNNGNRRNKNCKTLNENESFSVDFPINHFHKIRNRLKIKQKNNMKCQRHNSLCETSALINLKLPHILQPTTNVRTTTQQNTSNIYFEKRSSFVSHVVQVLT